MFGTTLFVAFVLALAGWAITAELSSGPGDYRPTCVSNSGPARLSEQVALPPMVHVSTVPAAC